MSKSSSSEDIFFDIKSQIGSMNILDDILAALQEKSACPSAAPESVFSSSGLDSTFDQSDGTSLGKIRIIFWFFDLNFKPLQLASLPTPNHVPQNFQSKLSTNQNQSQKV